MPSFIAHALNERSLRDRLDNFDKQLFNNEQKSNKKGVSFHSDLDKDDELISIEDSEEFKVAPAAASCQRGGALEDLLLSGGKINSQKPNHVAVVEKTRIKEQNAETYSTIPDLLLDFNNKRVKDIGTHENAPADQEKQTSASTSNKALTPRPSREFNRTSSDSDIQKRRAAARNRREANPNPSETTKRQLPRRNSAGNINQRYALATKPNDATPKQEIHLMNSPGNINEQSNTSNRTRRKLKSNTTSNCNKNSLDFKRQHSDSDLLQGRRGRRQNGRLICNRDGSLSKSNHVPSLDNNGGSLSTDETNKLWDALLSPTATKQRAPRRITKQEYFSQQTYILIQNEREPVQENSAETSNDILSRSERSTSSSTSNRRVGVSSSSDHKPRRRGTSSDQRNRAGRRASLSHCERVANSDVSDDLLQQSHLSSDFLQSSPAEVKDSGDVEERRSRRKKGTERCLSRSRERQSSSRSLSSDHKPSRRNVHRKSSLSHSGHDSSGKSDSSSDFLQSSSDFNETVNDNVDAEERRRKTRSGRSLSRGRERRSNSRSLSSSNNKGAAPTEQKSSRRASKQEYVSQKHHSLPETKQGPFQTNPVANDDKLGQSERGTSSSSSNPHKSNSRQNVGLSSSDHKPRRRGTSSDRRARTSTHRTSSLSHSDMTANNSTQTTVMRPRPTAPSSIAQRSPRKRFSGSRHMKSQSLPSDIQPVTPELLDNIWETFD